MLDGGGSDAWPVPESASYRHLNDCARHISHVQLERLLSQRIPWVSSARIEHLVQRSPLLERVSPEHPLTRTYFAGQPLFLTSGVLAEELGGGIDFQYDSGPGEKVWIGLIFPPGALGCTGLVGVEKHSLELRVCASVLASVMLGRSGGGKVEAFLTDLPR